MEKGKPSYVVGRDVNWCSHYEKQYSSSSKKLKIELPYDPAIPLLVIYPKNTETLTWKDICTFVFTAALFTIAKIRKLSKYPSTVDRIKKVWFFIYMYIYIHTHTLDCYSAISLENRWPSHLVPKFLFNAYNLKLSSFIEYCSLCYLLNLVSLALYSFLSPPLLKRLLCLKK